MSGSRLTVQPNELILQSGHTHCIVIVFNASLRESALCQDKAAIVSTVAFFYGDEISRQKYRR